MDINSQMNNCYYTHRMYTSIKIQLSKAQRLPSVPTVILKIMTCRIIWPRIMWQTDPNSSTVASQTSRTKSVQLSLVGDIITV